MSTTSSSDRWLLPRRQTEYPARQLLPEATLHGRREATFLVLAALFLVATSALVLLGTSRVIDVTALIARTGVEVELPIAVLLPLGVVPFALSFIASGLACALFGRRRSAALIWVGLVASLALTGVMRIADLSDGGDAFPIALALTACYLVAHLLHLFVFDLLRGHTMFLRWSVAALLAQGAGWTAFGLVLHLSGGTLMAPVAAPTIAALAAGAAAYSLACVLVLAIPAALVARGLAVALRVGHDLVGADEVDDTGDIAHAWPVPAQAQQRGEPAFAKGSVARKLPAALIVDDDDARVPAHRAPRAATPPPFSSAEMRFFSEGDAILD